MRIGRSLLFVLLAAHAAFAGAGGIPVGHAVGANADVSAHKTGPATAPSGSQITYNINVFNQGPSAATNTFLSDELWPGVTYVSVTTSQGSCTLLTGLTGTQTVYCTIGTLANGQGVSIVLVVNVGLTSGTFSNTAVAGADQNNLMPESRKSTVTTAVLSSVPTVSGWMLLAIAALLVGLGMVKLKG